MNNNILTPNKPEKKTFSNPVDQLFNYGYWVSKEFLPGMYYREFWQKVTEKHKILIKQ